MNMKRRIGRTPAVLGLLLALCGSVPGDDNGSAAPADGFEPAPIDVPDGFEVELAAAPPLVKHPMMADFDPQGRLYVAASAGKNLERKDLEQQKPNLIRRLVDTDGDGVFDESTVFADDMVFPMGALWHDGALYVASPPNIWRLEDTDGDGVAEKREIIVSEFGYTGNAASIHGCFLHPDGRIYWCDGRHGFEFPDGRTGEAAGIFSARPDGSDVEVFAHGGMDNPVEVVFTERGEILGTTNLMYARPRGDTLTHWARGGVYPRHDFVEKFDAFRRTGDLMDPITNFGHVAVSGLARYRGTQFGKRYRGDLFITQFNTHKVVRSVLRREGSTFTAQTEPFLSSPDHDVHFTDVLEDADGSLLVIDTGGWFRIGCPESQTAKPEIRGAIYRITRKGGERPDDPRGRNIDWADASPAELTELLDDARFAVRDRALTVLANRGESAVDPLGEALSDGSERARRNAVWALHRIGGKRARRRTREALSDDGSTTVRQAAAHCLGMAEDADALQPLKKIVGGPGPAPLRRKAATALGRIGKAEAVPTLLTALGDTSLDRMMEHALIYALIEIDAPGPTLAGLDHDHPRARRGALIALDQMESGELTAERVTPLLGAEDAALQEAAMNVIRKRPGWSGRIVERLRGWLESGEMPESRAGMLRGALLAFRDEAAIQKLVAEALGGGNTAPSMRTLLLEAMAAGELDEAPEAWVEPLGRHLAVEHEPAVREAAAEAIGALGVARFDGSLMTLAVDQDEPRSLRVAALKAAAPRADQLPGEALGLLLGELDETVPTPRRLTAARILNAAPLSESQRLKLTERLSDAGPVVLPVLLRVFEDGGSATVGRTLFEALAADAPAVGTLDVDRLKRLVKKYPAETHSIARSLLDRLRARKRERSSRLAELEPALTGGDPDEGPAVFQKATCVACHTIDGKGGSIGPDLSGIGASRSKRDLLEAIVLPSASFARGYEPMTVKTKGGETHFGRVDRETEKTITLIDPHGTSHRFKREQIKRMTPSQTSLMPQGLDRLMSEQELADLLAYLKSLK